MKGLPAVTLELSHPSRVSCTQFVPLDEERKGGLSEGSTTTTESNERPFSVDIRNSSVVVVSPELDDRIYELEVLELENTQTEESLDEGYAREALELSISVGHKVNREVNHKAMLPSETSTSDSIITVTTGHVRSDSSSKGSQSTGFTSHNSSDASDTENTASNIQSHSRVRRIALERPLSFMEYEGFLAEAKAQEPPSPAGGLCPLTPPRSSAPSVYSVPSKKYFFNLRYSLRWLPTFQKPQLANPTLSDSADIRADHASAAARNLQWPNHVRSYRAHIRTVNTVSAPSSSKRWKTNPKCRPSVVTDQSLDHSLEISLAGASDQNSSKLFFNIRSPGRIEYFVRTQIAESLCLNPQRLTQSIPFKLLARSARLGSAKHVKDWHTRMIKTALSRCKAQFCYICGAAWDPSLGCPNSCDGDAELERRRTQAKERLKREEEERAKREEAEQAKAFEVFKAARRSAQSEQLLALRKRQVVERDAFMTFAQKQKCAMSTRHAQEKAMLLDQHAETEKGMKEEHLNTATALEDCQVSAEFELRETFEQERRACLIRIRHMEAYCAILGNTQNLSPPTTTTTTIPYPTRTITPSHIFELVQQYNIRDQMPHIHQSRINILRERQAQKFDALVQRQEGEFLKLYVRSLCELEELERRARDEEGMFEGVFTRRRERLVKRWGVIEEIERRRLEEGEGVGFGPLPALLWPDEDGPLPTPSILLGQQA
ncbi:hypothetical protein FGG08_001981 [Glutinoglossum americanum]|uniref:IBR domain-containing protein n=1 Tax=Glutinoglossum americanum TaxID=1670608 RepID=A0A9P8L4X5_9PEZI|nr:hypothetical protein FGG08_001981 [Glutinoglossum americanum]